MSLPHGLHHILHQIIPTDHFNLIFRDSLHFPLLPYERVTTFQGAKLAFPQSLPRTAIIVTYTPRPGLKHGCLHLLHMGFGNKKRNLVHSRSFLQISPEPLICNFYWTDPTPWSTEKLPTESVENSVDKFLKTSGIAHGISFSSKLHRDHTNKN